MMHQRHSMVAALAVLLFAGGAGTRALPRQQALACPTAGTSPQALPRLAESYLRNSTDGDLAKGDCLQAWYGQLMDRGDRATAYAVLEAWFGYTVDIRGTMGERAGVSPDVFAELTKHLPSLPRDPRRDAIYALAELVLFRENERGPDIAEQYSTLLGLARVDSGTPLAPYQLRILAMSEVRLGRLRAERYEVGLAEVQLRRGIAATRRWLVRAGLMTPESDRILTRLDRLCPPPQGETRCLVASYDLGLRELGVLVNYPGNTDAYPLAVRDEIDANWAKAEGRWDDAYRLFAGAAVRLAGSRDPHIREFSGELEAGAANAAVMISDWPAAETHARRALALYDGLDSKHWSTPASRAGIRTILAEAALIAGRYDEAWRTAAIAEAEMMAWERGNLPAFDLRARYRDRDHAAPDPTEIRMLAGAMRYPNASAAARAEILDALATGSAWTRNSSLSDAIILSQQRADPAKGAVIDQLLEANENLDRARRAAEADPASAERGFAIAQVAVQRAEAEALRVGVRLDPQPVSYAALRRSLQPHEGFMFLLRTPFGDLLWGIDGQGEPFVENGDLMLMKSGSRTPVEPLFAKYGPAIFYPNNRDLQRFLPALSAALASDTPIPDWKPQSGKSPQEVLRFVGGAQGRALADAPLRNRADRWIVTYNNAFDGIPLAAMSLGRGEYFGTVYAYSVMPSIEALLVLRASPPVLAATAFVGVGGVPFRGKPCTQQASGTNSLPAGYAEQRDWILAQQCLDGTREQLEDYAAQVGRPATLLFGEKASEGALRRLRGSRVRVLAFATHAVPADPESGRWPALLLFPPLRQQDASDDGRLLASEAAALNITADLVVLSACSTGSPDEALGEEPLNGMARGFFLGGARSALVTRWTIRSSVAAIMNRTFAAALAAGKSRAEALRDARRAGLDSRTAEWNWGAFELVGEGGPLK